MERRSGKTRLVARDGKIMAESNALINGPEPISFFHRRAAIWPDGEIGAVEIGQGDNPRHLIRLTQDQAESLAKEIMRRIG